MPTPSLILTIAPEGRTMQVSLRDSSGVQGPAIVSVDLDSKLAAFVAAMQAIARQQIHRA